MKPLVESDRTFDGNSFDAAEHAAEHQGGPASDWTVDGWDDVDVVASVEPMRSVHRIAKWVVWVGLTTVTGLMLIVGWVGWWYLDRVRPDVDASDVGTIVEFDVLVSDTVESVAARLERRGLIADDGVFVWYLNRKGGLEVTPGFYEIRLGDHIGDVLARLRTPPDQTYARVTFPEGFTLDQIGTRLVEEFPQLDAAEFAAATNSQAVPSAIRPPGVASLEGLLFPDTYQVSNADNEAQVVERMVSLMERVAIEQEDLIAGSAAVGLTPYQVLIVASMIEREARLPEDRPKIARVIYNRLFLDMNLQIDATLYYGHPRDTPFSELKVIDSPYNTYLYSGLPPTPIANPGRASIRAALNPAPQPSSGDPVCLSLPDPTRCYYLYYVLANEEGGHVFAASLEQHEANVEAARQAGLL